MGGLVGGGVGSPLHLDMCKSNSHNHRAIDLGSFPALRSSHADSDRRSPFRQRLPHAGRRPHPPRRHDRCRRFPRRPFLPRRPRTSSAPAAAAPAPFASTTAASPANTVLRSKVSAIGSKIYPGPSGRRMWLPGSSPGSPPPRRLGSGRICATASLSVVRGLKRRCGGVSTQYPGMISGTSSRRASDASPQGSGQLRSTSTLPRSRACWPSIMATFPPRRGSSTSPLPTLDA